MEPYYEAYSYQDPDGVTEYSFGLSLGDNQDCETCDYSNNEANLDISQSGFTFWYQTGCYGGAAVSEDAIEPIKELEACIGHLRIFPNWNQHFEDKVKSEIASWLKDKGK